MSMNPQSPRFLNRLLYIDSKYIYNNLLKNFFIIFVAVRFKTVDSVDSMDYILYYFLLKKIRSKYGNSPKKYKKFYGAINFIE